MASREARQTRLRCCCCNARYLRSHASAKTSRSGARRSTAESQRWAVATQRPVGQLPAGNGACRLRCRRLPRWIPAGVLEHAWVQDQQAPIIRCVPRRATGAAEARARCGRVSDVDTTKAWCRPAFEALRLVLNADEGRRTTPLLLDTDTLERQNGQVGWTVWRPPPGRLYAPPL